MKIFTAHIAATAGVPCRYCIHCSGGTSCGNCVYNSAAPGLDNNFVATRDEAPVKPSRKKRRRRDRKDREGRH